MIAENTEFKKGNLISMLTGQAALEPGDFLLMNTDHIYKPSIAEIVARACTGTEITAFVDYDRTKWVAESVRGINRNARSKGQLRK